MVTMHSYVSQSAWDVLFVEWGGTNHGVPSTRKLIELSTPVTAATGDNRIETMATTQKRMEKIFTYIETDDVWICRDGSY